MLSSSCSGFRAAMITLLTAGRPSTHASATRADVADLPLAHKIVERPKGFLDRRVAVPSMHLVKVDVIGLEPAETALHFAQDIHAGCATPVEILAHRQADFGGEDNLVPRALQG